MHFFGGTTKKVEVCPVTLGILFDVQHEVLNSLTFQPCAVLYLVLAIDRLCKAVYHNWITSKGMMQEEMSLWRICFLLSGWGHMIFSCCSNFYWNKLVLDWSRSSVCFITKETTTVVSHTPSFQFSRTPYWRINWINLRIEFMNLKFLHYVR